MKIRIFHLNLLQQLKYFIFKFFQVKQSDFIFMVFIFFNIFKMCLLILVENYQVKY